MKLTLEKIHQLHDRAFTHGQTTRIQAADDRLFARVTQWDSSLLEDSQLSYRGEFNIIRKAVREIMSDLRANPVQVEFEPRADSRETDAELLDGLYLSDDRINTSMEAYENAAQETVDCGIGGWELFTEYESNLAGDRNQVIRRRPLYEFNNNVFYDPNAKLLDKSDARYVSILEPYSLDGYKDLVKELTGEDDADPTSFAAPENSYVFPWITGNELYYVARFYYKQRVKDKILTLSDPLGQPLKLRESDLSRKGENADLNLMDELIDMGYSINSEKSIKRWEVRCYIVSGERILKSYVVASEHIPVVPMYGERAFVEGEEHYEGVVRLAKDPQRLRNFLLSYLGDMVSRSPRQKPIFAPEQIAGFENMYQVTGAENNFPYLLQHRKDPNGNDLPAGPLGYLEPPAIPQALGALVELTRQAVEDVANPGLPKDIMDADVSGRAIELLQARLDNQSQVYQDHLKHAKRYDAVVYASMASRVYDAPRKVSLTLPDGTRKTAMVMDQVVDKETGELVTLNDLTNVEFEVYAKIGPSYHSKREKTREELGQMASMVVQSDPTLHKALMYKQIQLMDGINMADIKDYTNKQLMLAGFKEPETEEEISFMEQAANQPEQPDPATILAQAEMGKAQAAQMREQRLAQLDQANVQNNQAQTQVDVFRAQTDRAKVEVDAQKAGAEIRYKQIQSVGVQIDNVRKLTEPYRARVGMR
jgi:hypothetical protein